MNSINRCKMNLDETTVSIYAMDYSLSKGSFWNIKVTFKPEIWKPKMTMVPHWSKKNIKNLVHIYIIITKGAWVHCMYPKPIRTLNFLSLCENQENGCSPYCWEFLLHEGYIKRVYCIIYLDLDFLFIYLHKEHFN